jgi:hypothetical protein
VPLAAGLGIGLPFVSEERVHHATGSPCERPVPPVVLEVLRPKLREPVDLGMAHTCASNQESSYTTTRVNEGGHDGPRGTDPLFPLCRIRS